MNAFGTSTDELTSARWPKAIHLLPQPNYFRGGLLPRPPPDGPPVLLGPFSSFMNIAFSLYPGILSESCEPGAPPAQLKKFE